MKNNPPKNVRDAGSMLSQKTNEDFSKKNPDPVDFSQSKTYQKDKIHAKPDSRVTKTYKGRTKTDANSLEKTHTSNGVEFIDKK